MMQFVLVVESLKEQNNKQGMKILPDKFYKTTIALAGMVQSVSLVKELAQTGKMHEASYQASIYSIFQTEPNDIYSVYGNLSGIKLGLEQLVYLFTPRTKSARPLMHYTLSLLYLQKRISNSPKILAQLNQQINKIRKQVDYFHLTHPTVIANLADAYMNTISTFKFRIVIWGSQRSLSASDNMDKIRALLLAGIRSAVLWRQMGGSRLQLLFFRAKIKNTALKILAEIEREEINSRKSL